MILGITGNISSGKSTVTKELARLGAVIVDADQLAREVVEPGSAVLKVLVDEFGAEILRHDGGLDRDRLGQIIFADGEARTRLNRIIHPEIAKKSLQRLDELKQRADIPLIVYEAPLLFEVGAETRVDKVLVVKIEADVQLKRLQDRDQLDEVAAQQRIDSQMPQDEKIARADYVIDNSGSLPEVVRQVESLWRQLVPDVI